MTTISVRRDPVVLATGVMTLVLAIPLVLPILPPEILPTYSRTCTTIPFLLLAIGTFGWRVARTEAEERRFWTLMSAAVGCWLGQQTILIGFISRPGIVEVGLLGDLFYVGLYVFLVLAIDTRPHLRHEASDRGVLASLRRAGTIVFVFGLLVYLALVPAALDPDSYSAGIPSFTLYVVLDAYLVLRLVGHLARSADPRWRLIYGWLLATCSAWLVLDTVEGLMWARVLPWVEYGTAWDLPWMAPLITLVMTGRAGEAGGGADGAPPPADATPSQGAFTLGSPLILLAIWVPLLHFTVYGFELFDTSMRGVHELVAFGLLVALGGLVFAYQRTLEARNRRLELERREALARIEHQAYHDPLTTLPNRRLLEDRFGQATAQANRRNERLAILFFDLDGFKAVNDTSGHAVGDELLRQIGRRLASQVRSSDTLARVGGDEFVVMATDAQTRDTAARLASKIQNSLKSPFQVEGDEHAITASVGVSFYPDDGIELKTLLRSADAAMYKAKEAPSRDPAERVAE